MEYYLEVCYFVRGSHNKLYKFDHLLRYSHSLKERILL